MTKTAITILLALVLVTPVLGGSLLKDGKTAPTTVVNEKGEEISVRSAPTVSGVSLIAVAKPETRKFNVHDIITIIVREESSSKTSADSAADKKASIKTELKEWIQFKKERGGESRKLLADPGVAAQTPTIDASGQTKYEGEGEVNRKDSFLTKISAMVVDVKPNGTLVIEAKRFIQMDDEKINMTLTGMVRPDDVSVDNTVNSTSVADLVVTKKTEGIARDAAKHGWLIRLIEAINPF
ncbi:MAG: flagellar basal body L-ring protein FlgH [Planctomycetes bacterium]|nr:flagellar basal body L-ring protein FlgH [Planctomycetota bacterium]